MYNTETNDSQWNSLQEFALRLRRNQI